jgi:hydroxymethylbilane synthase
MTASLGRPAPLRLGTRASQLALTQSGTVADALRALGVGVELVEVRTIGDQRPPDTAWGEGAFVGALETALLGGEIDLAVHSAKDVPTTEDPRLVIAAFPSREDPRDALVGREPGLTLETLPAGSRVGTDSPRRSAFLRARRPDLHVHPLHGNVDTRLRRLEGGETDALVLAVAGLTRLGRADRIGQILDAGVVPPAPGQGSLAVQCRSGDAATRAWVARLDDPASRAAVEMERAFLRASGGGCRAPIGGLARVEGDEIVFRGGTAGVDAPDEQTARDAAPPIAWGEIRGPVSDRRTLAAELAVRLADDLLSRLPIRERPARDGAQPARVLVTRAAGQAGPLVASLAAAGIDAVAVPTIELCDVATGGALDEVVTDLDRYDWVVVTSATGAAAVVGAAARVDVDPRQARWVAVGSSTAAALTERNVPVAFTPARSSGDGIAAELDVRPGQRILLARADIADARLPDGLRSRGASVDEVVAYHTVEAPESSREPLRRAFAEGPFTAIVFTSGSTVRGLLALLSPQERRIALRSLTCCIGPSTGVVAREAGFGHVLEAPMQSAAALSTLIASAVASALESADTPAAVAPAAAPAPAAVAPAAVAPAAVAPAAAPPTEAVPPDAPHPFEVAR